MTYLNYQHAVNAFLNAQKGSHANPAILDALEGVECQINVYPADGELVTEDRWKYYTDGTMKWYNARIASEEKSQKKLMWPLELYCDSIGFSGWSYRTQTSLWVGYDFDVCTQHAPGIGVTEEQLERIKEATIAWPFAEVRHSTGGTGLHVVVPVAGIPTQDRAEHKALARCILHMMGSEVNFSFSDNVDHLGEILWVWARRASKERGSFAPIKKAEKVLTEADLPANWRDHIEVIERKRAKVRVLGVDDTREDQFDALTTAVHQTPLDDIHKDIIDELSETGFSTVWVHDHHLLQTHTCALKEIGLDPLFDTDSPGTDKAIPNCFMFPIPAGAWKVYRFSPGCQEAVSWQCDGEGWTWCYFNRQPDLATAARATGGGEMADNKGFQFDSLTDALPVAEALGETVELDKKYHDREAILRANKDGRLVVKVEKRKDEAKPDSGWVSIRGGWWEKVFDARTDVEDDAVTSMDGLVRCLRTPKREPAGWVIRTGDGWEYQTAGNVTKFIMSSFSCTKTLADMRMGDCIARPWEVVSIPFAPQFPGNRRWNLDAPQLRFQPANMANPSHPMWDLVLGHLFESLDTIVKKDPWCQEAGIVDGAGYGRAWIASVIRYPFVPTPYLFFVGDQDCGKSIFHEALEKLFTSGIADVEHALKEQFNGQLEGCVIAVLEEVNLGSKQRIYDLVKKLVTALEIPIRKMRCNVYHVRSSLHFVHTANDASYCPARFGDTRIMVLPVQDLDPDKMIGKPRLLAMLEEEAPQFLATLKRTRLPTLESRMRVPLLETAEKRQSILANEPVMLFMDECCKFDKKTKTAKAKVYQAYKQWVALHEIVPVSPVSFGKRFTKLTRGKIVLAGTDGGKDAYTGVALTSA